MRTSVESLLEKNKNEQRKYMVLQSMGGFISEAVNEHLLQEYPELLRPIIKKYCVLEGGTWEIADELLVIYTKKEYFENMNTPFWHWYFDATAGTLADNIQNNLQHFWSEWKLANDEIRTILEDFTALEEKIFCLAFGLNGANRKKVKTIAKMKEFKCESTWIKYVIDHGLEKITNNGYQLEEFIQVCDRARKM